MARYVVEEFLNGAEVAEGARLALAELLNAPPVLQHQHLHRIRQGVDTSSDDVSPQGVVDEQGITGGRCIAHGTYLLHAFVSTRGAFKNAASSAAIPAARSR